MIGLARDAGFRISNVPGDATVCMVRLPLANAEAAVAPFVFA
jgi:acetyltransferase